MDNALFLLDSLLMCLLEKGTKWAGDENWVAWPGGGSGVKKDPMSQNKEIRWFGVLVRKKGGGNFRLG